jgi:hypothetical protein
MDRAGVTIFRDTNGYAQKILGITSREVHAIGADRAVAVVRGSFAAPRSGSRLPILDECIEGEGSSFAVALEGFGAVEEPAWEDVEVAD